MPKLVCGVNIIPSSASKTCKKQDFWQISKSLFTLFCLLQTRDGVISITWLTGKLNKTSDQKVLRKPLSE